MREYIPVKPVCFLSEEFFNLEKKLNPDFNPSKEQIIQKPPILFSTNSNYYVLFGIELADEIRGVAYLKTHMLPRNYLVLVARGSEVYLDLFINQIKGELNFGDELSLQGIPLIEYGGLYIPPQFRGQGYARRLFEERISFLRQLKSEEQNFVLADNGLSLPSNSIVVALASRGVFKDELVEEWESLKNYLQINHLSLVGANITDIIRSHGIDPRLISEPREESTATKHMAKKEGWVYLGANSGDGGPIYGKLLNHL
jgi:GNAT superfamily N-acetyltransferase